MAEGRKMIEEIGKFMNGKVAAGLIAASSL